MTQNEMVVMIAIGTTVLRGSYVLKLADGAEITLTMESGRIRCNLWSGPLNSEVVASSLLARLNMAPRENGADGRPLYTWTVQIGVSETWVEDGFDLDNDRLADILGSHLGWATDAEYAGAVLASPPKNDVLRAQGYDPDAPVVWR